MAFVDMLPWGFGSGLCLATKPLLSGSPFVLEYPPLTSSLGGAMPHPCLNQGLPCCIRSNSALPGWLSLMSGNKVSGAVPCCTTLH